MRSWRAGFDIPSEVAAGAPLVALAVFAVGVAPSGIGDTRVGMFPWTTGAAALCLAPAASECCASIDTGAAPGCWSGPGGRQLR